MRLFCQCGYPIRVGGQWTGQDYRLLLYDGEQDTRVEPIAHCPRCGEAVHPADLHWQAPVSQLLPEWKRVISGLPPDEGETPSSSEP